MFRPTTSFGTTSSNIPISGSQILQRTPTTLKVPAFYDINIKRNLDFYFLRTYAENHAKGVTLKGYYNPQLCTECDPYLPLATNPQSPLKAEEWDQ